MPNEGSFSYSANPEEEQYYNIIKYILENGIFRDDRTGTGTISVFAPQPMKFNLRNFPLLTSKKMNLRIIFEELMWFIRGQTDSKILYNKGVHIWDANSTRDALDDRGLYHLNEGDLGPIYGFQWRHFGAKYNDSKTNYINEGVDQLYYVIKSIVFNPKDRRIILTAWNPEDISIMALPPCHMTCQFYVANNKLSCQLYQRSADMGLGIPFNIASYALFVHILAHFCNLDVGEFTHVIGDAHIYINHIDVLKEQITRSPYAFPKIKIKKTSSILNLDRSNTDYFYIRDIVHRILSDIESLEYSDIELTEYNYWPALQMQMSV